MKKIFLLSLLYLTTFSSYAQSIDHFERLVSKGQIPDFFVKYLDEKIASDKQELKDDDRISDKNAGDFTAITNYKLQQLIQSGKVLYGDPLTVYANKVLDKLKAEIDLDLSYIQLYTLKSNEVNAFATHQGVIFITVGLIGQLENEAQLAFILAHELTHVIEKHNQIAYQHTSDLTKSGRYGEDVISSYYKYSKSHEEDADLQGFKYAVAAGYAADALFDTYNVLLYSYLPIDEVPVEYSWLENDGFKVTEKYKLEKLDGISAEEDVDDEYSTHPNIRNRRSHIKSLYNANKDKKDAKIYIAGNQASFEEVRALARFEMVNNFILKADYARGLYHNYILTKSYPDNAFLKNTSAMMWYGMAAHQNSSNGQNSVSYRKQEGEMQQWYYLLYKLKDAQIAAIATKQVWEASLADPENTFLKTIRQKVLLAFVDHSENKLSNFGTALAEDETDTEIEDDKPLSKYDKIAKKNKSVANEEFTYYALLNVASNADFVEAVYAAEKELEKEEEGDDRNASKPQKSTMNVKSLIMTTPSYYLEDNRKSIKKNVNKNELNEARLVTLVEENAKRLDIDLQFVGNFRDTKFDTDAYNNFSLLYDYLGERTQYGGLGFYPYNAQYTDKIKEQYGSHYVGMIGIYTEVNKRDFNAGAAVLSLLTVYLFPVYLKWQFTADKYTDYGFMVYNLDTNNPAFMSSRGYSVNMNIHLQNAHIYNSLNQITKKNK